MVTFIIVYILSAVIIALAIAGLAEFITTRIENAIERRRMRKYQQAIEECSEWLGSWGA